MADEKFRRPKWCTAPRSPERHKQLVRAVGGEAERSWEILEKSVYTVGRHESADFQLQGELVSRIHAAVLQDVEGQRYLVDLKSTHGTFLESKRLKPNEPAKWPEGQLASFGFGPKAVFLVLGAVGSAGAVGEPSEPSEPAEKRPRTEHSEVDPMAALYGDLPEASIIAAPKVVETKMQPLPTPTKDPTRVIFLDIDGVLRPLHSRQDAFQNTRTIEINGARVPLLGSSEAKAGVDFWPSAMRALRFIVQKTEARIVLSSDWRKQDVLVEGIGSAFEEHGIPKLYSSTPDLDQATPGVIKALHSSFREKRCKEIRKWLKQNPKITHFCAIDDVDLSMPDKAALKSGLRDTDIFLDPDKEFVKTNPIVGLTMEISKLVICYLNGTEPSEEILTAVFGEPTGTITKLT
ncbi:unnamed protein product [Cladocopium goreaui]|uniref:Nuclear inhibitor of protein phosphatase 1 (NIPP-1) (Protein phosphatase 1 regulatory inhibitor subunit 8) n=1 Tax=Cladocopium goreaui TaxID=2562237 RepID=A0A9P1C9J4_9DINO|nr:unnamed protein product [Cladocopium goreaui]